MHFPNIDIQQLLISIPPLLFALTLHEVAHGRTALLLGDPTARDQGRLSLNPLHHLDPVGTLALLFIGFGWAKPVPVNPRYFKMPLKDMLWVALAGPVTNLILAFLSALLLKLLVQIAQLLPAMLFTPLVTMLQVSVMMNVMLCVFNFLPIPPLDGSRIVTGLLPTEAAVQYMRFEQYGVLILIGLMLTGVLGYLISPLYQGVLNVLLWFVNL